MKSHSGAKKRFKLTATGKVKRYSQNKSHILSKNPPREREDSEPELTFRPLRKRPSRGLFLIRLNKGEKEYAY